ncbi:hypothetical protein PPACK8108_LOCUS9928 [Phakopsora pachyrhizi]|uniref:Uncharacterized protein n=1 Tax=Phakopsora pachyrhizi TaxID=170000 RepID=A0AAV0AZA2_PHAPC|nr:hypothetical protein PPACK8108_LOCUS9928 [Phakopsora pachyrhizi]
MDYNLNPTGLEKLEEVVDRDPLRVITRRTESSEWRQEETNQIPSTKIDRRKSLNTPETDGAAMVVEEDEDGIEGAVTKDWMIMITGKRRKLSCLDRFANLQISEDNEWTDSVGPEEDGKLNVIKESFAGSEAGSCPNPGGGIIVDVIVSRNGKTCRTQVTTGQSTKIEERFLSSAGSSSSKKSKSEPVRMTRLFGLLMEDDEEEQHGSCRRSHTGSSTPLEFSSVTVPHFEVDLKEICTSDLLKMLKEMDEKRLYKLRRAL